MKKIHIKCQWHIIVITVCICLFSLMCWASFARSMGSALILHVENSEGSLSAEQTNNSAAAPNENVLEEGAAKEQNSFLSYADTLDNYVNGLDTMWYEAMYKKSLLSKMDLIYTYYSTGEIASSQVIKGKKKWLFYNSAIDSDSIGDFEGTKKYSPEEMDCILKEALWTQEELKARGINFTILVAPNKENVYSEYMPDMYTHSKISGTDILIEHLANNNVKIINPKEELLKKHSKYQLYYSYDTHWNQLGAYIGVRNVLETWNIQIPSLEDRTIVSDKLFGNYHYCGMDDLAEMAGLRESVFSDEVEYEIEGTGLMDWTAFESEQESKQVSYYSNPEAQVQATLLLIGDSFRSSMVPSLRETFSDVYVVHRSYYTADVLNEINPEYLISEYVERYSDGIGSIKSIVQ